MCSIFSWQERGSITHGYLRHFWARPRRRPVSGSTHVWRVLLRAAAECFVLVASTSPPVFSKTSRRHTPSLHTFVTACLTVLCVSRNTGRPSPRSTVLSDRWRASTCGGPPQRQKHLRQHGMPRRRSISFTSPVSACRRHPHTR